MDQLFITSARIGLEPDIISQQPLAGSVFRVHTQVSGIVEPLFSGEAMGKLSG
jgi:sugar lactone lactonase YvrE